MISKIVAVSKRISQQSQLTPQSVRATKDREESKKGQESGMEREKTKLSFESKLKATTNG